MVTLSCISSLTAAQIMVVNPSVCVGGWGGGGRHAHLRNADFSYVEWEYYKNLYGKNTFNKI